MVSTHRSYVDSTPRHRSPATPSKTPAISLTTTATPRSQTLASNALLRVLREVSAPCTRHPKHATTNLGVARPKTINSRA